MIWAVSVMMGFIVWNGVIVPKVGYGRLKTCLHLLTFFGLVFGCFYSIFAMYWFSGDFFMDFSQLLNQILGAAQKGGKAVAESPLNSFGGGALTGALASMLLKKKNAKKLVKAGSVAALGFLAYKGYQNWKQNQQQDELPQSAFQPAGLIGENHSRVILQTMIAAAASDGLIDDAERAAIERESGSDAETAAWLQAEYAQPASIEQIAASVGNDEALAAETYLAARLVCADLSRKEIVFLSRLSQALNLDDQLVESLEKQLELA